MPGTVKLLNIKLENVKKLHQNVCKIISEFGGDILGLL